MERIAAPAARMRKSFAPASSMAAGAFWIVLPVRKTSSATIAEKGLKAAANSAVPSRCTRGDFALDPEGGARFGRSP